MSTTFPEYSNSSFPDLFQDLEKKYDVDGITLSKVLVYQSYMAEGNLTQANLYKQQYPEILTTMISAEDWNKLIETIKAVERWVTVKDRTIVVSKTEPTGNTYQINGQFWYKLSADETYVEIYVKQNDSYTLLTPLKLDLTYSTVDFTESDSFNPLDFDKTKTLKVLFGKIKAFFTNALLVNSLTVGTTRTTERGTRTLSIGDNNKTTGNNCTASGKYIDVCYNEQSAFGKYNNNKDNDLFEIGCGTSSDDRDNAVEVKTNGDTVINKNLWIYPDGDSAKALNVKRSAYSVNEFYGTSSSNTDERLIENSTFNDYLAVYNYDALATIEDGTILKIKFDYANLTQTKIGYVFNGVEYYNHVKYHNSTFLPTDLWTANQIVEFVYCNELWHVINVYAKSSTTQEGVVKLNDTLTSTSTSEALTAAKGNDLKNKIDTLSNKFIYNTISFEITATWKSFGYAKIGDFSSYQNINLKPVCVTNGDYNANTIQIIGTFWSDHDLYVTFDPNSAVEGTHARINYCIFNI